MSASSNPSAKRKINVQKTMDVAKKRNKRDAALRFDLFSTGLLKISAAKDMNRLEILSAFKNHADNPKLDQVNRIQNLLILQKQYVDEKNVAIAEDGEKLISSSSLSRTTCFIPFSHHYPKIFQCYYSIFINKDANVSGCPSDLSKFVLSDFNREWKKLRTNTSLESNIVAWRSALSFSYVDVANVISNTPEEYFYVVGQFKSGDLCLFLPGVIHSIIGSTDTDTLRVKVSSELSQSTTRTDDTSAGSFKKAARAFENSHIGRVNVQENCQTGEEKLQAKVFSEESIREIQSLLVYNGVVVLRDALGHEYSQFLLNSAASYLHQLLGLPSHIDLLKPQDAALLHNKAEREQAGISDASIRRSAANSRTTIIPKDHGITGFGVLCQPLQQAFKTVLKPVLDQIYQHAFHSDTHTITDICIHFQTPIKGQVVL